MRIAPQLFILSSLLIYVGNTGADADSPTTMATTMPTSTPSTITWEQAKDYIGQSVTVIGPVVGTHDFGGAAVLNIGKDFPDPTRFTVYISADNRAGIPDDLDKGKTISVTGTLKVFHDVPEIEGDAAHITIINQGPTTGPATQP
jgi:hypothetical protein